MKQPLASLTGEKRILWRINLNSGLAQQNTTRAGRIHQVSAHPLFTGFAVGLNPHHGTVCVKPQQSHASPRQQLHTGLHGLAPQPGPEGSEVEHNPEGIIRPPLVFHSRRVE